jgi:hypothetical protein
MPTPFRTLTVIAALLTLVLSGSANAAEDGFKLLFNGRDLSGWRPVNTAPSTWKVEDGMLICSGKPIGELRTLKMYQNFILELEWRHMVPKGNAGVFVWADDITAPGVPFHRGIEVQVLENAYGKAKWFTTHGDIFPIHGAKMTPINGRGGSRAFPTKELSKPSPEWNHYRIECRDGDISLAVNGEVVTRGKDCSPSKGYICLESEGGVVHYRNIRIKELPDTPIDQEDIATAERGYRSIYTGVDLSGWTSAGGAVPDSAWKVNDWTLTCNGGSGALNSNALEIKGDYDFIVDIRLKSKAAVAKIFPRSTKGSSPAISTSDERIAPHLAPSGKWTRLLGKVRGNNRVELSFHGKPDTVTLNLSVVKNAQGFAIDAEGSVDFANLYVREAQ